MSQDRERMHLRRARTGGRGAPALGSSGGATWNAVGVVDAKKYEVLMLKDWSRAAVQGAVFRTGITTSITEVASSDASSSENVNCSTSTGWVCVNLIGTARCWLGASRVGCNKSSSIRYTVVNTCRTGSDHYDGLTPANSCGTVMLLTVHQPLAL